MHGALSMIVKEKLPIAIHDKRGNTLVYGMVLSKCTTASFCSGRSADHFSSISACSWVSTTGSRSSDSTTEKNSVKVIPNASQIFTSVGKVGTMFLLYHVEIVVGLIPAWKAKS